MISWADIAGLALGAAEALLAPLLVLVIVYRRWRLDARFLGFGIAIGVLGLQLFPYAFVALRGALDDLVWKFAGRGARLSQGLITFNSDFAHSATSALLNLTLGLVALAVLRTRDRSGQPALAFGFGLYGLTCCTTGRGLLGTLNLAVLANHSDLGRIFGAGDAFAAGTFVNTFQLGASKGAAAVCQFAVSLIVFVVAEGGWRRRRLRWIVAAYGAAVGLAVALAAISAFSKSQSMAGFAISPSSFSLEAALAMAKPQFHLPWFAAGAREAFMAVLGLALVLASTRLGDRFVALVDAQPAPQPPPDDGSVGLFATWKNQSRPK